MISSRREQLKFSYSYGIKESNAEKTANAWANNSIYLNGEDVAVENNEYNEKTIYLALVNQLPNVDPKICEYIANHAHSEGFLNTSINITRQWVRENKGFEINNNPDYAYISEYDFIGNNDGSVTFIERTYIQDFASSLNPDTRFSSTQEDRPLAIIVTSSTIALNEDRQITHTYASDRILLTDRAAEQIFSNDDYLIERYDETMEEVAGELNDDISLKILTRQTKQLATHFNPELAAIAIARAAGLIKVLPMTGDWITLETQIKNLQYVIKSQSPEGALENATIAAQRDYDHFQEYLPSGHSIEPPSETLSNESKGVIISHFPHADAVNTIKSSENYQTIIKQLPVISETANVQRFFHACNELDKAIIKQTTHPELAAAGKKALELAFTYFDNKKIKPHELPDLIKWISDMAKVVENPNAQDRHGTPYLRLHIANTKKATNIGNKHRYLKCFAGAMLAVLGIALIAVSILALVSTYAVSSPISVPALALGGTFVALGASLLGSKIAIGVLLGAGAALGVGALAGGSFFADTRRKGEIRLTGDKVTKAAKNAIKAR